MTIRTADELLARMVANGGAIVSTGVCSEMEIADAHVRGDIYVDEHGLGYVLRMKKWLDRIHERDGYMQESRGVPSGRGPDHVGATIT